MRIKIWDRKSLVVLLVIGGVVLFLWGLSDRQKHRPKASNVLTSGQIEPTRSLDKGTERPTQVLRTGLSQEYNSAPASTPLPVASASPLQKVEELSPLVLCDLPVSPTPSPTPKVVEDDDYWLPRFTYIPCVTAGEIDSGHITTPVVLIVTKDIYQRIGINAIPHLIIPANTKLGCFASPNYFRDRVEVKGTWTAVFVNEGTECTFEGVACDQEFDPVGNHYGPYEKSAGLKGRFRQSDHYALLRNLTGLLLTTATNTATSAGATLLQNGLNGGDNGNVLSVQTNGVAPYLDHYIQGLINPNQLSDTLLVRVPPVTPCYVLTTSVVEVRLRSKGANRQRPKPEEALDEIPSLQNAAKILKSAYKQIETPEKESKDENQDKSSDPSAVLK